MRLNEYVSYATFGIGQVTEITTMLGVEFITITILDSRLKISIPKTSNELVRPLMSREDAEICQMYITQPSAEYPYMRNHIWKKRNELLMGKLQSNKPIKIAEVVCELEVRKSEGLELTYSEKKMLEAARALVQREIDLVLR